jgi:molecular chaperone GrpE
MVDKNAFREDDIVLDDEAESTSTDEIELEDDETRKEDKIAILRKKLKTCESEKMLALEEKERARADFLNSKRRIEEQAALDRERGVERTLHDFLTLLDSFEIALAQKESDGSAQWRSGVEAMYIQFQTILKKHAVTEIETLGKHFNPHEHDAVGNVPTESPAEVDTVKQVLQKGYRRKETILRPAKVLIGA